MVSRNGYIKMDKTINYYNQHAQEFCENTKNADMSHVLEKFIAHLPQNALILDAGCGSGRDSKYFLEKGLQVEAFDASEELCKIASEYTGIKIKQMLFEELDEVELYDGVWACASILHVEKKQLPEILKKIATATKKGGIVYTSFKYGEFEGIRNGRFFTYLTEESFGEILRSVSDLAIEKLWISADVRAERGEERWLNIVLRKLA